MARIKPVQKMKSMNPKILIVEHDSTNIELIHHELIKSNIKYTSKIVQTKKEHVKVLHYFKPDIIRSNYTFPEFDGTIAFKIKEKYIVKDTVQILQGSIEVHSEEGKGTTFNIILKNLKP